MSTRGAASVIAGLVLLVGVLLGFGYHATVPGPAYANGQPVKCGSAFVADHDAASADMAGQITGTSAGYQAACSDELWMPRIAAFGLVGIGLLGLLFCGLTIRPSQPSTVPAHEDVEQQS